MRKFDYTKLKSLREEKGITQGKMSHLLNMTQSNYSKLENGLKKIDSLQTLEDLAFALKIPIDRLMGIMSNQENLESSGIKVSELLRVEEIIKKKPLRQDEFIFFSTEVLELEKHEFKEHYSGVNLKEFGDNDPFPMWEYPPKVNLICADSVEVGFEYKKKTLSEISVWLANKKLGVIPELYVALVAQLVSQLLISRIVLIDNEDHVPGYFDTYMKVVFIATNAVCKSAEFKNGRFSSIKFLTQEEIDLLDNEDV